MTIANREEFNKQLKAAIALAKQFKQKLLEWGKRMEEKRNV